MRVWYLAQYLARYLARYLAQAVQIAVTPADLAVADLAVLPRAQRLAQAAAVARAVEEVIALADQGGTLSNARPAEAVQ